MEILFPRNIFNLRAINATVAVLSAFFAVFPIITENNFVKAEFYFIATAIALFLFIFSTYKSRQFKKGKQISNKLIYILFFVYYANVMYLGLYLAVWAEPGKIAGSFIGILICALFPFVISPVFYYSLTFAIMIFYITVVIMFKDPKVWNYDIQNGLFAGIVTLVFGWQTIMYRMTSALNISKLEAENIIDALTQLKNRRDFMNTFQRFISNHRQSDEFLCIAILDIDFFKNYNDHYGHPQGDECLRSVGKALNNLSKDMGIYTARVGGEEFALLWHIEKSSDAEKTGWYVNQLIKDLNIPHEKSSVAPYITVSVGIHTAKCGISHDIKDLYNLADTALYTAKKNGRNCTVVSS
jgi:diguanylate cyclase (GGDEF)-like protein